MKPKPVKKPLVLTMAKLKSNVQIQFNKFIRNRDSKNGEFVCIACGEKLPIKTMNAGHFFPVKAFNHMRYLETNVHGECQKCNGFDKSSLIGYTLNIQKKLTKEQFEELIKLSKQTKTEFKREYLFQLLEHYKKLNKK